jgi:hypothetical protein
MRGSEECQFASHLQRGGFRDSYMQEKIEAYTVRYTYLVGSFFRVRACDAHRSECGH